MRWHSRQKTTVNERILQPDGQILCPLQRIHCRNVCHEYLGSTLQRILLLHPVADSANPLQGEYRAVRTGGLEHMQCGQSGGGDDKQRLLLLAMSGRHLWSCHNASGVRHCACQPHLAEDRHLFWRFSLSDAPPHRHHPRRPRRHLQEDSFLAAFLLLRGAERRHPGTCLDRCE